MKIQTQQKQAGKPNSSRRERGVITLCGVQGCCPTVDFRNKRTVVLKDDHGGQVKLTRREWNELKANFA
ncbi:MAG: hypothetical protein Q7R93_01230 [bacterium]|nr:hypothetical protein [bacterium]